MALVTIAGMSGAADAQVDPNEEAITVIVGRSVLIRAPWPTSRVAVTAPAIADVQVLTPEQVLVQGLQVGSTDLILWSEDEQQTWQRRVVVRLDVESIRQDLHRLFPTAELTVSDSGDVLLVQGLLRGADQAEQLHRYLEHRKITYVDMTSVAGVQQVQLQVRVAEVGRQALRVLGTNWFTADEDFFFGQRVGGSGSGPLVPGINIGVPAGAAVEDPLDFVLLDEVSATSPITAGETVDVTIRANSRASS
jgi:pilus assembly protein CpaC